MLRHTLLRSLVGFAAALGAMAGADAALLSRAHGLAVYDTARDITWLADANLAATNAFGVAGIFPGGYMDWNTAQSWIAAMNAATYLGTDNWRLPETAQPDPTCNGRTPYDSPAMYYGYYCKGSEMGHLFYQELGGLPQQDINVVHNANYNLLTNVPTYYTWSATRWSRPDRTRGAWAFDFGYGLQNRLGDTNSAFAWAVASGDVLPIPEPPTAALLALGLLVVATARQTARRQEGPARGPYIKR
jgi:hypothetical protein